MSELTLTAHAKINLTLEVLGRRGDGFHEIRSVMQRISLADTLHIRPARELSLTCSEPALEGPDNLVWRAATLLRETCAATAGAALRLDKRVPVAAGLGGGSSDCAAALIGLNELWQLRLSIERLRDLGARLGSDVPFFLLETGCALAEGRGERLTALAPLPERWLVLAKPVVGISAGAVYGALTESAWSDGRRTTVWLDDARQNGTVPAPFNALELAALAVEPSAVRARDALIQAGADAPVMSGSGSTYFALCHTEAGADRLLQGMAGGEWEGRSWRGRFVTL